MNSSHYPIPIVYNNICVLFKLRSSIQFNFYTRHIFHPFFLFSHIRRTIFFISPIIIQKSHMGFIHISAFKHSFAKSRYCSFMNSFYSNIR